MAVEIRDRTIGSARDYSTIQGWEDACPSNLTTGGTDGDGVIWRGLLYAEGPGTDGEWSSTSQITISGSTVDATRYVELTTAAGQSFRDDADKATNALRYNPANGVAILLTGNNDQQDRTIDSWGQQHTRLTGLQIRRGTTTYQREALRLGAGARVDGCIVRYDHEYIAIRLAGGTVVNSLIYCTNSSGRAIGPTNDFVGIKNCTLHGVGGAWGVGPAYNSAHRLDNSAVFGFTDVASTTGNMSGSSSNNATNLASVGFGSSNQTSLTAADQFESLTGGSEDFRAKSSGSLDGNAVRDASNTNDLDIVGQARSTTVPWIGAWETPAAVPPTAPTGVTAGSVTALSATASWTDASSDETGFKVEYAPSPYSSWTALSGSPTAADATSLATGNVLTDGASYKFRVASTNANGDSAWVESGVFNTPALTRLRPNADTTVGAWTPSTGSTLFGVIDETTPDDADYITASTNTTGKVKVEVSTDPADDTNHSVSIRARATSGTLTVSLVQGHPSETLIKAWTPSLTSSFATYVLTMSSGEAAGITDYSDLYLKFVTT